MHFRRLMYGQLCMHLVIEIPKMISDKWQVFFGSEPTDHEWSEFGGLQCHLAGRCSQPEAVEACAIWIQNMTSAQNHRATNMQQHPQAANMFCFGLCPFPSRKARETKTIWCNTVDDWSAGHANVGPMDLPWVMFLLVRPHRPRGETARTLWHSSRTCTVTCWMVWTKGATVLVPLESWLFRLFR